MDAILHGNICVRHYRTMYLPSGKLTYITITMENHHAIHGTTHYFYGHVQ